MKDTADIRKLNMSQIRQILFRDKEFTVADIKAETGLSTATCNTILNLLVNGNEVKKDLRQLNGVGRKTAFYKLNLEFDSHLDIQVFFDDGKCKISYIVLFSYGGQKYFYDTVFDEFDENILIDEIKKNVDNDSGIKQVLIGFPSGFHYSENLEKKIADSCGVSTFIDYDLNYVALCVEKYTTILTFNKNSYPRLLIIKDSKIINDKILNDLPIVGIDDILSDDLSKVKSSITQYIKIVKSITNSSDYIISGNALAEINIKDDLFFNNIYIHLIEEEKQAGMYIIGIGKKAMELKMNKENPLLD